jgi:hypothetical protein
MLVAVLAGGFLSAGATAWAQTPPGCGDYRKVTGALAAQYGEYLAVAGTTAGGDLELWVADTRTWSLLRVMPGGIACLIAAGQNVRFSKPPAAKATAI